MAYYAFLDENNIVTEVIPGKDETELIDGLSPETWYGNFRGLVCKRTSYNTFAGQNTREGGIAYRKNFGHVGMTYDETRDAFIPPKPFPSWILNEDTCRWEAPTPKPKTTDLIGWKWNEETLSWESFTKPTA